MRDLTRLRNFGIIAHIDAGKTTISERMLFVSGQTHSIGETHDGASKLDHLQQERERGITIGAAATTLAWRDHRLNLIDTPGHVDFTVEVERSLRVLDGAVAVFDAVSGVEPQSETVWRQADRHGVPRLAFINKMDREGADFDAAVASITERLGATCVVVHLPIGEGSTFCGMIDLVAETVLTWESSDPGSLLVMSLSDAGLTGEQVAAAARARNQLIELVAEHDDMLCEAWMTDTVTNELLRQAIRRATIDGLIVPTLSGAALAGMGTQPLLDGVVAYLPSPADRTDFGDPTDTSAPFAALAFKVKHGVGGKVVWTRVYRGSLAKGSQIHNATTGRTERASRLLQLNAGQTTDVERVNAGDIVAIVGTKHTSTGHTLCDPNEVVELDAMDFPEPVMSIVVEPAGAADQDKLAVALSRLAEEDPTFAIRTDPETGETLMAGMGELHLQVLVESLRSDHGVAVRTGEPKVAHRETITQPVRGWRYRLSKQTGGPGMFAEVVVDIEPTSERAVGELVFVDNTTRGSVPASFAAAFAAGATEALSSGPVEGHPVVGVQVTLTDGATHPNDSSEQAFRMAGAHVMRDVLAEAAPIVLEPVMAVHITTPEESLGAVMGLIGQKRGRAAELVERTGAMSVEAFIPLATLFGFVGDLRSVSKGRASASMQLHSYEPRPTTVSA